MGKLVNIVSVFALLWCTTGFLSGIEASGLRTPSLTVHFYAWFFILVVSLIILRFYRKQSLGEDILSFDNTSVWILQIVSYLLYAYTFVTSLIIFLNTEDFEAVRELYYHTTSINYYLTLLFRIIPSGLMDGLIIYYVYRTFATGKFVYLIYASLNVLLLTFSAGGRYAIMLLFFCTCICFISQNYIKKRLKNYLFFGLIALLLFVEFITLKRGQSVGNTLLTYFSGSLSFLDYIIENPFDFGLNEQTHGYLTFGAIIEPFVLLLKVLGLTKLETPSYEFDQYCQEYYNISTTGDALYFNNNTTILYYFIRDFGEIGVIIGAILISLIIVIFMRRRKKTVFSDLVWIYFGVVLFESVFTYQFFGSNVIFTFIAFYFLSNNCRYNYTHAKNE